MTPGPSLRDRLARTPQLFLVLRMHTGQGHTRMRMHVCARMCRRAAEPAASCSTRATASAAPDARTVRPVREDETDDGTARRPRRAGAGALSRPGTALLLPTHRPAAHAPSRLLPRQRPAVSAGRCRQLLVRPSLLSPSLSPIPISLDSVPPNPSLQNCDRYVRVHFSILWNVRSRFFSFIVLNNTPHA